jgi:hypothetical protein
MGSAFRAPALSRSNATGTSALDDQTSQLPGTTGLRALAGVMSQHGEGTMLAIYDRARLLRPGRAAVDRTVDLAVHSLLTPLSMAVCSAHRKQERPGDPSSRALDQSAAMGNPLTLHPP